MCMDKVEGFITSGHGWKIFLDNEGQLEGPFQGNVVVKGWNVDRYKCELRGYPTGYHIFTNKKSAKLYMDNAFRKDKKMRLRKVNYKNVVATGYKEVLIQTLMGWKSTLLKVVVARKMEVVE